ncbi:MAG: CBS domain-containing protein [Spirochaetaceae bacterium]|nr:CBS domain-containing protein [Myxococcales bacterium]MCB9725086.1 CBS domain-containing protein [Spirochaetaceae bacterium]
MDLEIKAFMTGSPVTIAPETSALAALDLMIDHAIRHLPVVTASGRIHGVVSFEDLRAALPIPVSLRVPPDARAREAARDVSVAEVMTHSPITIAADAPLDEAVSKMLEGRFGCLPVVDEAGRLDGILTETDLLQALATLLWSAGGDTPRRRPPEPETLVGALERERAHLLQQLEGLEHAEHARVRSHRETAHDLVDEAQDREAGILGERLAEIAARRVHAIDAALERAERGMLERCEACGERIPERRLRALPGTTLCIRCGRAAEQIR